MTYQIVEVRPMYHWSTDGLIGHTQHPRPMSYRNLTLAQKLAGRLSNADYDNGGDNSYVVVEYGGSAFDRRAMPPSFAPFDNFADMPF